ncbi:hypothetical protein [Jeotgalibaca sp. A127]|uniref:hypothetical protein n=1 Tax=Jeotgalibaca sp. A127 TaxID=3457324 RepID=UPI003FD513AA
MSVKITRKTGWIGLLVSVKIRINGDKVARINDNQTIEMELPTEEAMIQVTQQGFRSNKLQVKKGDKLMIQMRKSAKIIYLLMSFTPLLSILFLSGYEHQFLIGLVAILGLGASLFLFNAYTITKIP